MQTAVSRSAQRGSIELQSMTQTTSKKGLTLSGVRGVFNAQV
jgi:hypothetical protein